MKKIIILFVVGFIFSFAAQAQARVQTVTNSYTNTQIYAAIRFLAKKAGYTVVFFPHNSKNISKNSYYICSVQTGLYPQGEYPTVNSVYACKLLFYTNWFQKFQHISIKKAKKHMPVLNKKTYRNILFTFLAYYHFIISQSVSDKYKIYVLSCFATNKKYNKIIADSWGVHSYKFSRIAYTFFPAKGNKNPFIAFSKHKEVNKFNMDKLVLKRKNEILKQLYAINKKNKSLGTFGLNSTGLRKIDFNIVNLEYIRSVQESLNQILNGSANVTMGTIGTANFQAMMQNLGAITAINRSVNATLLSVINRFMDNTINTKYLYNSVDSYYSQGLQGRFGELKTSFLSAAGIAHITDISYTTILEKSNMFLNSVNQNKFNLNLINKALYSKFKLHGTYKNSYVPNVIPIEDSYMKYMTFLHSRPVTFNRAAYYTIKVLAHYKAPGLSTLNFYSFSYYLIKNIYLNHNYTADKLLRYIVLNQFNKASRLLKINNQIDINDKFDIVLNDIKNNKLNKASRLALYGFGLKCDNSIYGNVNLDNVKDETTCKTYHLINGLILYKKFKNIGSAPWDAAKKKYIFKEISRTISNY